MADECIAFTYSKKEMYGDKPDALVTTPTEEKKLNNNSTSSVEKAKNNAGISNNKYVANMPVERYATEYNMNHKFRGRALIFNHEFFDIPSLKSRAGTNVDSANLTKAFENLDFNVSVHKDCKLADIMTQIREVAEMDHSDNDCIAIAILSHGELGYIFAKDAQYKLDYISQYFCANRCPSLAGKPKLFFLQACQGDGLDPGIQMTQKTETDGESSSMTYRIPLHADFLFAYSTIPGFYSWRNIENGSWFMQSLIKELNENGRKHDILTLLTFVNQSVALNFESNVPHCPMMHQQKQTACITTMLTRILRFNHKNIKAASK